MTLHVKCGHTEVCGIACSKFVYNDGVKGQFDLDVFMYVNSCTDAKLLKTVSMIFIVVTAGFTALTGSDCPVSVKMRFLTLQCCNIFSRRRMLKNLLQKTDS